MRKSILAAVALAALSVPVFAADMPVKATPLATAAVHWRRFGFSTWGVSASPEADVAQSKVSGNNLFAPSLVTGDLTAADTGGGDRRRVRLSWATDRPTIGYGLQATGEWSRPTPIYRHEQRGGDPQMLRHHPLPVASYGGAATFEARHRHRRCLQGALCRQTAGTLGSQLPDVRSDHHSCRQIPSRRALGSMSARGLKVAGPSGNFGSAAWLDPSAFLPVHFRAASSGRQWRA